MNQCNDYRCGYWNGSAAGVIIVVLSLSSVLPGCKTTRSGSPVKVIGGIEDYQSHPAAVGLLLGDSNGLSSACTGTVVRDDLIVTAAHCLSSEKITKAVPFSRLLRSCSDEFDSEKFGESEFLLFPEYKNIGGFATVGTDIAFIVFPKGTLSGFTQAKFSKVPAKSGDVISIVGYGDTAFKDDDSNPQLKRFTGQNVITNIDPECSNAILSDTSVIGFTTAGLGQGDSGGPLFNTDGEIVGISKGNMLDLPETTHRPSNSYVSDKNKLYSVYLNIAEPNVAAFIASIMRDPRPSKAKLEGITYHPLQESPFSPAVAKCEGNGFCKDGWGWLASGEANCKVGAPGWIPEKNGCSCTCN